MKTPVVNLDKLYMEFKAHSLMLIPAMMKTEAGSEELLDSLML